MLVAPTLVQVTARVRLVQLVDSRMPVLPDALTVLLANTPLPVLVCVPYALLESILVRERDHVITVPLEGTLTPVLVAAHTALRAHIRRLVEEAHVLRVQRVLTQ